MDIDGSSATDLFDGMNILIKNHLGVTEDYRTRTAALELAASGGTIDGEYFVNALFERLRQN